MLLIFGQNLIYWSGIFTGIFFLSIFLGCRFSFSKNSALLNFLQKNHKKSIYLALVFFLIHLVLAILNYNFGISL
ncbi:MAG: hypothetical protein UT22_C0048G0002 [Parcubacteria group bacterium GW2011_GWC2_39_11]|nr:MAG: hypothetical protein UT22_C0048G0002 [Parcubacteria group bacterium GW2011_GWC2_39_11]